MRILTLLLFQFLTLTYGQNIQGKIISNEDKLPIPYAKIGVEDEEIGTFADKNGIFSIDLTKADRKKIIKIEVSGFQAFRTSVENFIKQNPQNIILAERIREIQEVIIIQKKFQDKILGYKINSKKIHFDYLPKSYHLKKGNYTQENLNKPLGEIAVPIETKKRAKILNLNINLSKFEINKPMPARFNIYTEKDGKPDQLINVDDIIVELTPEKITNGTFSVDVSDKNIWIKGKYFISFQPLNRDFEGNFFVSAGFLGTGYYRSYLAKWIKFPISGCVGINATAKVEK